MSRSYVGFRHIKTTQERRAGQEGWSRGKRNSKNLPNQWDDITRWCEQSWKNHRKHQYKIKNEKSFKDSSSYAFSMSLRDHWHYDHRRCSGKYRRCNWCWNNDIWDDSPNEYQIRWEREERERELRDLKWELMFYPVRKRHHKR